MLLYHDKCSHDHEKAYSMDESALSIFSESEEDHMLEIKLRILHGTHKDPLTLQDNL